MAQIKYSDDELAARAKANVKKYIKQIKAEIVKEAKKQGHNIKESNVKSVTFKKLKGVQYDIFEIKFDKFIITDPQDMIWLDGMTWNNNSPGMANRKLVVGESSEDTYTWQITAGFTVKYESTTEMKIYAPAGGSVSSTWSFAFDFHVTRGIAHKKTHKWEDTFSQDIPPHTKVRMEVCGVQFVGYAPFKMKVRATGQAHCACKIDYWGTHSREFDIDLGRILNQSERTFISEGRVDGVQGYEWNVNSSEPMPLNTADRERLPEGVTEEHLVPHKLSLKGLRK